MEIHVGSSGWFYWHWKEQFYSIAETLGAQMGCVLFQFPPSYRYTPGRLKIIESQLDPAHRNAVEFRHKRLVAEIGVSRF
jgi:uncharacterized protein YecE (DUF72 family)